MNLDELPTHCAIAESCGLVSALSGIISSHSSVGLRSFASGMLAFIQNAIGSRESQKTEHCHLKSHRHKSSLENQMNDLKEEFHELRTTMCNMATQIAEHFGRMDSRLMKYDSILGRLDLTMKSDFLRESRFQRRSKTGADAIEIFDEDFFIKTGNTFRLRERPENEDTNFIPKTLFSPLITSDVAQLSFTVTTSFDGNRYGAVNPHLLDTGTQNDIWNQYYGVACWATFYRSPAVIQGIRAPPQQYTREYLLEADCRVGQQTLKHSSGRRVDDEIYVNIPLPFRFAINIYHPSDSVTIKSLTFTTKPTLKGGARKKEFGD
ncbi:hypothetical protein BLNAU_13367 [Blattamonas nauphoetae]|uniref:Uncharacterized protein n=1 Tax=Blattamonas nauphoetae TaxID=2049346 RepID=A0ABQ9XGQ2_9EUKA|nr:hypothetical protein BLNAU_13367 [Blattamonas nauphoetae]